MRLDSPLNLPESKVERIDLKPLRRTSIGLTHWYARGKYGAEEKRLGVKALHLEPIMSAHLPC